ncbi:response regulator transcription factor [Candidatus Formimonas warabiya]|uniref:Stage 0 sporulation protein A homolog n=1 Tax=Formimonas warabiya TaxID=1761012 RepID=A0A3G1KW06_FORW1|nr:response regulator transcription factor [Candidatus Formimonas warabiya]ATW26600.1 DNA-binding response regulator [Candidatus Formimonas warabiya]
MESKTILVVDDDKNICELLDLYLTHAGFTLLFCHDGSSALKMIQEKKVDLVLLDIMLPVINGWEVCRLIKLKRAIPVIMLTARDMLEDKIEGFASGADDYIVKPFQPKEVIARIQARLREKVPVQQGSRQEGVLEADHLVVDINSYEVRRNGALIELKPKEVQLLYFLLNHKNMVFSREQLLEKVWNYQYSGDTRTVDVHIKSLRKKLDDPKASWRIKTVWGVGYKLEVK